MESGSESDSDRMDLDLDDDPTPLLLGNIGGEERPSTAVRKKGSCDRTKSRWIARLKQTSQDLADIFPGTQVMLFMHYTTPKTKLPNFWGKAYGAKASKFLNETDLGKEIKNKIKVTARTWPIETESLHEETLEHEEEEQSPEDDLDVEGSQLPKISAQARKIVALGLAKSRENKLRKEERLAMLEQRRKEQRVSEGRGKKKSTAKKYTSRAQKAAEEVSVAHKAVENSDQMQTTNRSETLMSEAQVNVISELFPGRGMDLSGEEWSLIENTLFLRGIPLLWEPQAIKNVSAEETKMSPLRNDGLPPGNKTIGKSNGTHPIEIQKVVLSHSSCGMASVAKPTLRSPIQDKGNAGAEVFKKLSSKEVPTLNARLPPAKKGTGLVDNTRPRVFPKVVQKYHRTEGTVMVVKPSLGSPILSKPSTEAELLHQTSDQGPIVASICNSNLLANSLTEEGDSTQYSKVSTVAQKLIRAEETTVMMTPAARESMNQKDIAGGVGAFSFELTAAGKQVFDELFPDIKRTPPNLVELLNKELRKRGHPPAKVIETPKVAQKSGYGTTGMMAPEIELPAQVKAVNTGTAGVKETPKVAPKSSHLDSGMAGMMTPKTGSSTRVEAVNIGVAAIVETPKAAPKSGHLHSGMTGMMTPETRSSALVKAVIMGTSDVETRKFAQKSDHLISGTTDMMTSETGSSVHVKAVNVCVAGVVGTPKVTPNLGHMAGQIVGVPPVAKPKAIKLTAEGLKVLGELFPDKKLPRNFIEILNAELCKRGSPPETVAIGIGGVRENSITNQKIDNMSGTRAIKRPETGSPSLFSESTVALSRQHLERKPLQNLGMNVTPLKRKNPFEEKVNDPAKQNNRI